MTERLSAAPPLASIVACVLSLGALLIAGKPYLQAQAAPAPAVQTSALGHCGAPSEGEHLVVTFRRQGERVLLDSCFLAGSRGTYGRRGK